MSDEIESTQTGDKIVNQQEQNADTNSVSESEEVKKADTEKPLSERDRIAKQYEDRFRGDSEDEKKEESKVVDTEESKIEKPIAQLVKVKIDGEELELPIEEVIKGYQKDKTADKRLQQAAQERKELEELRKQTMSERQKSNDDVKEPQITLDQLVAGRKQALKDGNIDDFELFDQAIAEYRAQQYYVDPTQISKQTKAQIEYETALDDFVKKNDYISTDEVMYNFAMQVFEKECKDSTTYREAFEKTEKYLKEKLNFGVQQTQADAMTARKERKATIPNELGRANATKTAPPPDQQQTPQDVIREMRKARGLPF